MSKVMSGDKVAVVKTHDVTDTPFVLCTGELLTVGRGLKTEDRRAKAKEGVCTPENEVDAPGWAVVKRDDGSLFSVSLKNVKLLSRAVLEQHEETLKKVVEREASAKKEQAELEAMRSECEKAGFDVKSLSDANVRVAARLLRGSVTESPAAVAAAG